MELAEIRKKKQMLEHDILALIHTFEHETTVLIDTVTVTQATTPHDFPERKTVDISISATVF